MNKINPVQINLNLKINPGINSNILGAYGNIIFDDKEILYSSIEEASVLQSLIEKLSTLSKAGNILATELYDKINNRLEAFTNEVSIKIMIFIKFLIQLWLNILIKYCHQKQ